MSQEGGNETENTQTHSFIWLLISDKGRIKDICVNAQLASQHLSSLISGLKWTTVTPFCLAERRYIWLLWKETLYCREGRKAEQLPCLTWRLPLRAHRSHQPMATKDINLWLQITQLVFPHIQQSTAHATHCSPSDLLCPFCISLLGEVSGALLDWKIIGFGKWLDGSVWSAKFGRQSLHAYHGAQLHTAGFLCFMAPR